ncbi:MAG: PHP domain-containing protein [Candidatus Bipolaricaulota bacterium]
MSKQGFADLHVHTVASDGTQTISDAVRRAVACGLATLAITDHDTISRELDGRCRDEGSLELITGIEVKADFDGVAGELLAYYVDPQDKELQSFLAWMRDARTVRMEAMVEKCREEGLGIGMEDVRRHGKGNLGRPHLARALIEAGHAEAFDEAFARFLVRGRPCYVQLARAGFREVVEVLHRAGGAVSVAHPCLMRVGDWGRFLDDLAEAGVDGLETVYPYRESSTTALSIAPRLLAAMAAERGFLVTGGSDDHGPDSTKTSIGQIRLPYEHVEELKRVAGIAA